MNLLLILFGTSCKERPCPEYEVRVDTQFVNEFYRVPLLSYHGFDTLNFLTEKGDTITFLGQGINSVYFKVDNYGEDKCSTKSTTYKQLVGYTFFPLSNYPSEIEYNITDGQNRGINFYIIINGTTFYTYSILPANGSSEYTNNLNFNGITYNYVLKIKKNRIINEKSFIYYSKDAGIIQINFENGHSLTKIK